MSFSGMVKEELSRQISMAKALQACRNYGTSECMWKNDSRRDTTFSDRKIMLL